MWVLLVGYCGVFNSIPSCDVGAGYYTTEALCVASADRVEVLMWDMLKTYKIVPTWTIKNCTSTPQGEEL